MSLPQWLDDQVRDLWRTEGASFSELIHEVLASDEARPMTEDEVVAWRRRQRLQPGVRQRTLRLAAADLEQLHHLVTTSGGDPGVSGMVAVLLTSHPSIRHPDLEPSQGADG